MKNYFLCLKPMFDDWLKQWFEYIVEHNIQLVRVNDMIRKYSKASTPEGGTAITGAEATIYYLYFCPGSIKKGYTLKEITSGLEKSEDHTIHVKLFRLRFQDFDQHDKMINNPVYDTRKTIMDYFSVTKADAERFLIITYLIHEEIRQNYDNKNTFINTLPSYKDLEDLNSEYKDSDSDKYNDNYNPMQYKRYCSMQRSPIWQQEELEKFSLDVIQPYIDNRYSVPPYTDMLNEAVGQDKLKYNKDATYLYKLIIQFITSFTYAKNLKFFHLYTPPPSIQKKRISTFVTLEVLVKCMELHKKKPLCHQTEIMRKIAKESNCDFTTIDKFIKVNLYYSPEKINNPMDLFCLSEEEIKKFYINYLIGHGQNPKNYDLDY